MIRILVAEHLPLVRRGLVASLEAEPGLSVVAEVATGADVVPAALAKQPDVAVVDLDLPGGGLTAAARLRDLTPGCRVLILSAQPNPGQVRQAFTAHALGFMSLDVAPEQLVEAVRQIGAGRRAVDTDLAIAALESAANPLTRRELDVLRIAAGAPGPRRSPTSSSCRSAPCATICRGSCARPVRATVSTRSASPATPAGCSA